MIKTIELFPELNKNLITLLKNLDEKDWLKSTVINNRTVKDLAAHLLDGSLRRLSMQRDHFNAYNRQIHSYGDLVSFIQQINREWMEAAKRLSPEILIYFLDIAEKWLYDFFKSLDPNEYSLFNVAWAGEEKSKNWFDIAREYTEKWHHQMQIRLAVNQPGINSRELFYPVIDTFLRGLPFAFRDVKAASQFGIKVIITGEADGTWFLEKNEQEWELVSVLTSAPRVTIEMTDDITWKLFTNSMDKNTASNHIKINGDEKIGSVILNMRTVMS